MKERQRRNKRMKNKKEREKEKKERLNIWLRKGSLPRLMEKKLGENGWIKQKGNMKMGIKQNGNMKMNPAWKGGGGISKFLCMFHARCINSWCMTKDESKINRGGLSRQRRASQRGKMALRGRKSPISPPTTNITPAGLQPVGRSSQEVPSRCWWWFG